MLALFLPKASNGDQITGIIGKNRTILDTRAKIIDRRILGAYVILKGGIYEEKYFD